MSFAALGLSAPLLRAIAELGYETPTAVQQEAIPAILRGGDVWASAQTGSGKTAAFALPLLQHLSEKKGRDGRFARSLILVPTRELAAQIAAAIDGYKRFLPEPIRTMAVFGGVSINPAMMSLGRGVDILIATPGRLLDLVDHNAISLSSVQTLVLDEADRLFSLGFAEELARILALLPKRRQNLLFSATFPQEVWAFAEALLLNPVRIEVKDSAQTTPEILERAIEVDAARRTHLLRVLVQENNWSRTLVFVATKYATEHVAEKLRKAGVSAEAFHGELSQGARTRILADFKSEQVRVLISTDLASRGIDIARLPVVVNYDLPRSPTDYVHRIGRTGRAGEPGTAVSFISADTDPHFRLIEKRTLRSVPREQLKGFEPVEEAIPVDRAGGGIKGKRMSKKDKLRAAAARVAAQASRAPRR